MIILVHGFFFSTHIFWWLSTLMMMVEYLRNLCYLVYQALATVLIDSEYPLTKSGHLIVMVNEV